MDTPNRQISRDWRMVDLTGGDYKNEIGKHFIVRVGIGGSIVLRNTVNDTQITIQALDGERIEFMTDTIYQASTAEDIQAIY